MLQSIAILFGTQFHSKFHAVLRYKRVLAATAWSVVSHQKWYSHTVLDVNLFRKQPKYTLLPHSRICNTSSKMFSVQTPCNIGDPVAELDTPALLVCLKSLDFNLKKMTEAMKEYPNVCFRAHAKTHKCPMIARLQVKSGAVGVLCQKVTEAESMVAGGIEDVFLSNQIIGRKKLLRVASLARSAKISICVDSEGNIEDISKAAGELGVILEVVVEVNVGGHRCGVESSEEVVNLAKKIQSLPNIKFKGLQCYNGKNQHIRSAADKKAAVDLVVETTVKAIKALKDQGIECNYVTGGGTGTFHYEAASGVFTEVQPGSYVFMDVDYGKNLDENGLLVSEFQQSLYVLSTVQSVIPGNRAVLDSGLKALSMDSGVPKVAGKSDLTYYIGGDEHGILRPDGNLQVGDQVWLIPGHCDPTVNMHEWIVGLRDGKVESIWPISGRGPGK